MEPAPAIPDHAPRDDATTRARIVRVALEAFSELGFDGASTRVIATHAGALIASFLPGVEAR